MLEDGEYDAFIVWADDQRDDARILFHLAITTGEHKGDVVEVIASRFSARDAIDFVGLPCTLVVRDGEPRIEP